MPTPLMMDSIDAWASGPCTHQPRLEKNVSHTTDSPTHEARLLDHTPFCLMPTNEIAAVRIPMPG